MNQSRLESAIEVFFNYLIGFIIAYLTFQYLVPLIFNIEPTHGQSIGVTILYTVISIIRSFLIRRYFNARLHRAAHKIAMEVKNVHSL